MKKLVSNLLESLPSAKQISFYQGLDLNDQVEQLIDHHNDIAGEKGDDLRNIANNLTAFEQSEKPVRGVFTKIVSNVTVKQVNR